MSDDPHQIIIEAGDPQCHTCTAILVHHRDFPEIRVEGLSAPEAAGHLLRQLLGALNGTPNHWHRDDLERAISDVRDFLERGEPASEDARPTAPGSGGDGRLPESTSAART